LDLSELIRNAEEFIETFYLEELQEQITLDKSFLNVDFSVLSKFSPEIADRLLEKPLETVEAFELALEKIHLSQSVRDFKIRFFNLPPSRKQKIKNVRSKHIDKFFTIEGTIRQKTDVRPQVTNAKFECPNCGNIQSVLQTEDKFVEPTKCACGRKGKFKLIEKDMVDIQSMVLEEATEDLEGGEQPKRIKILLKDDLVSPITERKTNPGSKVLINGILIEKPIPAKDGGTLTRFDLIFEGNYLESIQEDYTEIMVSPEKQKELLELSQQPNIIEKIIQSFAPGIFGHDKIKEAMVLQFVGGVKKDRNDGVKNRGDIHILLIGDPGAGKCLAGDSKIILENGDIKTIKELAFGNYNDYKDVNPFSLCSLGFNGEMKYSDTIRVWKRKSPKTLLEIKTRTGRKLKLTKDHPLFTTQDGYIFAKEAKNFSIGERITLPRKINVSSSLQKINYSHIKYSNNTKSQKYPEIVNRNVAEFLGYLCGDGYVAYSKTSGWVSLTNNNLEIINKFSKIVKNLFDINLIKRKNNNSNESYILSKNLVNFIEKNFKEILGKSANKSIPSLILKSPDDILANFLSSLFECDSHVNVSKKQIEYCTISKKLASEIQISLLRFGIISLLKEKIKFATNTKLKRKIKSYDIIISGENVKFFKKNINYISSTKQNLLSQIIDSKNNTNIDLIPGVNELFKKIRKELNLTQKDMGIKRSTYAHFEQNNRLPSKNTVEKIVKHLENKNSFSLKILKKLYYSDVFWDEIISIKDVESNEEFVYDLEVNETHNFVAEGVIVHNSQLLKRAQVLAPKGRYVSGKGASGAGLTASVVRDEFMRGWALEAGALVLANKGVCLIDELDKMTTEDRSAMHEALEQQTVTINKANVQATLTCQTTVLAAANPKFGRFDPFTSFARQLDLPPALISRFDLIFPIRDIPKESDDERLASFILDMHQTSDVKPPEIDTETLKLYIVFARSNFKPVLTNAALEEIKRYYVKMRNSGTNEGGVQAVPITARQLEAMIRLAEASAKLRYSNEVTIDDAKRSVSLMHYWLSKMGIDPDTGKIDIDKISSGMTTTERSKIIVVRQLIDELEKKFGKEIEEKELIKACEEKGITKDHAEEIITKMLRKGDLFNPKRGVISKI